MNELITATPALKHIELGSLGIWEGTKEAKERIRNVSDEEISSLSGDLRTLVEIIRSF